MPFTDPPQLLVELPARSKAEAALLRRLFPEPAYRVGCGSSHIWLHHAGNENRLAIIR